MGGWCRQLSRNVNVLRGEWRQSVGQRRRGEYKEIQGALINAGGVLRELSILIEALRIDANSQDSFTKYNAIKNTFNDLLSNFMRIC